MKPKEYIKKYGLDGGHVLDNNFIMDLQTDFEAIIEVQSKANWSHNKFKNCVTEIRQKWDSISNKCITALPENLWSYFYATVVGPKQDEMFGEMLRKQRAEKKRREEDYYTFKKASETFGINFDDLFNSFFKDGFGSHTKFSDRYSIGIDFAVPQQPSKEFQTLGLNSDSTIEDIKNAYRKLAFQHHPDRGGSHEMFIKITEAKDKCLAYLEKKS